MKSIDILMITYNRPEYTRLALPRLLETCDESARVWLWHNGDDEETLEIVRGLSGHPRVHRFHHEPRNAMLREPTNWFWRNATGDLLGKVDDDCLVPHGWLETLQEAHEEVANFGIISAWPFLPEDYDPSLSEPKIGTFGRHRLLQNFWVGGSGYLMKRAVVKEVGLLHQKDAFSQFCIRAAKRGWLNGWYFPLVLMDHMDDPRSPNTTQKTERDFHERPSLSSRRFGTASLEEMRVRARSAAIEVQSASITRGEYFGPRARFRRLWNRLRRSGRIASFHP